MFYIARQQKLDGPLREINKILKSKKIDPSDYNDAKDILFGSLATVKGDATRKIRDMRPIIENPRRLRLLVNELDDTLDDLEDYFEEGAKEKNNSTNEKVSEENETNESKNISDSFTVKLPKNIVDKVNETVETEIDNSKLKKAEKAPLKALSKAVNYLQESDPEALYYISEKSEKDKQDILRLIAELKSHVKEIEAEL